MGNTWLDGLVLPQPYAGKVASLRALAPALSAEIAMLEAAIAGLLEHHDGYHAVQALPGIGPVLAARIVEHRRLHGRFHHVDELLLVHGIGPRLLEKLRPWLREPTR